MSQDHSAALAVPGPSQHALALAEMTEAVAELVRTTSVELDIPVEQVAGMAVELSLTVAQVDALMLARQDHDARFSVMDLLLRSGFTTDQVHAAYAFVDQFDFPPESKLEAERPVNAVVEEPTSLADLVKGTITKPAQARERTGQRHLEVNVRNKYVAMVCVWFATLDVFADLSDLDVAIYLLANLVQLARDARFIVDDYSDLDVLTKLLVRMQELDIDTYDGVLRFFSGKGT